MAAPGVLQRWFRADEALNDDRGWTYNLAIFRIVFLAAGALPLALGALRWTRDVMPGLNREAWAPVSFFRYLSLDVISSADLACWLARADVILILLGLLGVLTRPSLAVATVLSVYVFGLGQNQGKVDHYHHVVWFMALLAAGPSGRFLSVDSLIRSIRSADRGVIEPPVPPRTALSTLRYTWVLLGLLYVSAGLPKLHRALTDEWSSADNLRHLIWAKWFELQMYQPGFALPWRVDALPSPILALAGVATIAFEIGFVAAVLLRPFRPVLGLGGLAFHVGNGLVLAIWFEHLLPAYVCLFDWTAMGRAMSRRCGFVPLVVLYDSGCRLCRRTVALLRSVDLFDGLEPVAGISDDPRRQRRPEITDDMLARDLYVVDGRRIDRGYVAYQRILIRLPLVWPLVPLVNCPPIPAIGARLYRRIADSRSCALVDQPTSCSVLAGPKSAAIAWVGGLLVFLQAGVSGLLVADAVARPYVPAGHPMRRVLEGFERRRPVWPFDRYPDFSRRWPGEVQVWEPRAVLRNGREVKLGAAAFAHAFGDSSARAWVVTMAVLREKNAERRQARSQGLIRSLWPHETEELRRHAVAVNVYQATYRTDPSHRLPVDDRHIYSFPIEEISTPRAPGRR